MKNLLFLLLILPLTSCTNQELGWFILSPNNAEGLTNLRFLLSGLTTTIYISAVSIVISALIGFIVAIPSLAKNKFLTFINISYVEIGEAWLSWIAAQKKSIKPILRHCLWPSALQKVLNKRYTPFVKKPLYKNAPEKFLLRKKRKISRTQ